MGRNFDDYPGLQQKSKCSNISVTQCTYITILENVVILLHDPVGSPKKNYDNVPVLHQKGCFRRKTYYLVITDNCITCTVNIYRYKTIEANGNTGVIPTTNKSFSLYREFL
jgi:hypothetical protein